MRHAAFGVLVVLCSVTALAGTITSLSPSSIAVRSAEHFVTIHGSALGNQVTFTGPAGTFTVNINSSTSSSVTAWVPQDVVNNGGTYSVTVSGSNALNFTVVDPNRRFVLLVPEFLIVSALSREGSPVKYDVSWWSQEKEPEPPRIDCSPASGSHFKFGTTRVDCTATSSQGERDQASFSVNVLDDVAPELKLPDDIVTEETEEGGAIVKFDTSAFDAIDGDLRVTCSRTSGTLFPVGLTRVTCSAIDLSLNPGVGSFIVEVRGKGRLALDMPVNLVAEADGPDGSPVDYEVTAYGTEDPEPTVKCDPPSGERFRIGATTVYCFAEDRFGGTAEGKFELNVVDTLGPVVSNLFTDPQYLVPVDGSMVSVRVVAEPVDLVDPKPQCTITGITANEEISTDDWKIVSDREVALRARIGGKTDRIYRIAITCYDENRNESSAVANAIVPASGEAPKPGSERKPAATGRRRAGGK